MTDDPTARLEKQLTTAKRRAGLASAGAVLALVIAGAALFVGMRDTGDAAVAPQPAAPAVVQMVAVAAGPFQMGCNGRVDRGCYEDENRVRTVSLGAFQIDKTEVTVAQYEQCVKSGACPPPGASKGDASFGDGKCNWGTRRTDHPINCLTPLQAAGFCRWQSKRLPTSLEWEKAARGTDGRAYPWGNTTADIHDRANVDNNAGTSPVGRFPRGASPYGALDMAGNVWEWTNEGELRGGSFMDSVRDAHSSRDGLFRDDAEAHYGFRCAR